jgi:hypothetical protein
VNMEKTATIAPESPATWKADATDTLLAQRVQNGWGYRAGASAAVEPTVLASLGLLGQRHRTTSEPIEASVAESADWLAQRQEVDGAVPNDGRATGRWATTYADLLWKRLTAYPEQRRRAIDWLLARRGRAFPRDPKSPIGHDTSLIGWPWIEDTHSWVEPTALAVLALCREGLSAHARTQEGVRLILDRAVETGGWNYGNNVVFGRTLRPRPAPTGIALLALAAAGFNSSAVDRACKYLELELPRIRSAQSLCWGILGLSAWGRRPAESDRWLAETFQRARRRHEGPCQTAYLLLAAGRHSLSAFGIDEKGHLS